MNEVSHFILNEIERDLAAKRYEQVITRFPPEPNGYLHIGHAKSILLNFGLAARFQGRCHLRMDDTNPETESEEYAEAIKEAVTWLGGDWGEHLYYASDYFETMYRAATLLIERGLAYVDSQPPEALRASRGTLTEPGLESPYRNRSVEENLKLFSEMRAGLYPEGAHVLRARIDMAHPNINLRDPVIYRIKHAAHYRQGRSWCIYPTYTFAHPIEDAIEGVTHSLCTLEFEDQRPFYDWLLEALAEAGLFKRPLPRQIEFARLNLTYTVLSKRKLIELVERGIVAGWDDPRMPTIMGARRRGYSPEGFRLFAERIGISKSEAWIEYEVFEEAQRDALDQIAVRRFAVLDPVKLIITNFPEGVAEPCSAPNHPQKPEWGDRTLYFGKELWIERSDFAINPPKGFKRLSPGAEVRLKYAYVVRCTDYELDSDGQVHTVYAEYLPDSKSGTPTAEHYRPRGVIHWLYAPTAVAAELRRYDRLFSAPIPGAPRAGELKERHFLEDLNPASLTMQTIYVEPDVAHAAPETRMQFERLGYFVTDRFDHRPAQQVVINQTVSLKSRWS